MNSFNVYGQTEKKIGGSTPVWLGTVKPIPVGAKLNETMAEGSTYPAGSVVCYDAANKTFDVVPPYSDMANGYLYNDIHASSEGSATGAIVMHHPEGLLIERVHPEITEEQVAALQARIPGVLLVRG